MTLTTSIVARRFVTGSKSVAGSATTSTRTRARGTFSKSIGVGRTRQRLEVNCRTAFEKRIESKRIEKSSSLRKENKRRKQGTGERKGGEKSKATTTTTTSSNADKGNQTQTSNSKDPAQIKVNVTSVSTTKQDKASTAPARKSASKLRFQKDFGFGEQGAHVEKLQRILLAESYLTSRDQITGYFGRETKEALIKWQKANRVMPSGYFGPISRALINKQGNFTKAKQQIAVQYKLNPTASTAVSSSMVGIVVVAVFYALRQQDTSWVMKARNIADAVLSHAQMAGLRVVKFVQEQFQQSESVYEEDPKPKVFPGMEKKQMATAAASGKEQVRGREEFSARVELRRNIASLQNELGYAEDQLKNATWQLKREKERADRAESLYLQQKSEMQLLEMENQKLKTEIRTQATRR